MIELVVVYCLIADAKHCVEQRLPMQSPLPMACMVSGQQEGQHYVWEHPKYRMTGWRCEIDLPKQLPS